MRNLKRALSLALASVMLLGMMVVGTSAASYPDVDSNDNVEAIEVLNAVKVMIGEQGNFNPDSPVNRHQMAVIMAKLVLGNEIADKYVGTHPFTDVAPWADKYVAACYENGIVAGTSKTTFGGDQPLTAVQAAAFMLRALGYKDLSKGASDWSVPVTATANQLRLFSGVASNPKAELTRNQVAQLALNTLKSPVVDLKDGTFTATDGDGKLIISGGSREYIARSSSEAYAKAINDTEVAGTSASQIGGCTIELGEHLYNGKLKLNNDDIDDFGRPARTWTYDGNEIGSYGKTELLVASYTEGVTGRTVYDKLGQSTIRDNDLIAYVDGYVNGNNATGNLVKNLLVRSNSKNLPGTGRGVLTEVYLDNDKELVTIVSVNTYLAKANSDYNSNAETVSLNVYDSNGGITKLVDKEDVPGIVNLKKDDWVLVNWVDESGLAADKTVVNMMDVEVLENVEVTGFASKTEDYTNWNQGNDANRHVTDITTGGKTYKANVQAYYKQNTLNNYSDDRLVDKTYTIYMDQYGNFIGAELYSGQAQYVFITGFDKPTSHIGTSTAKANAIFTDGTMSTIEVNVTDTNKNIAPNGVPATGYTTWQGGTQGGENHEEMWYTYSVRNNVYTLTPVKGWTRSFATAADTVIDCSNVRLVPSVGTFTGTYDGVTGTYTTTAATAGTGNAYGEDASVYITVGMGNVVTDGSLVKGGPSGKGVTEVKGLYTGVQNVKLLYQTGSWAHAVYDDDNNYIIACVVLGEAEGVVDNYAYIRDGAKNERIEKDSNGDYIHYWDVDVIMDGAKATKVIKSKYSNTTSQLRPGTVQELILDSEGYITKINVLPNSLDNTGAEVNDNAVSPVDDKVYSNYDYINNTTAGKPNSADLADYSVYDINVSTAAFNANATGTKGSWVEDSTTYYFNDLTLQGRTLKFDASGRDKGLPIMEDAKAVIRHYVNGDWTYDDCGSVAEAFNLINDADRNGNNNPANGKQFSGRVVAVLNSTGRAEWVFFQDNTKPQTNNPNYDQSTVTGEYLDPTTDLTRVQNILDSGKDVVINGSWLPKDLLSNHRTLIIPANRTLTVLGDLNCLAGVYGGMAAQLQNLVIGADGTGSRTGKLDVRAGNGGTGTVVFIAQDVNFPVKAANVVFGGGSTWKVNRDMTISGNLTLGNTNVNLTGGTLSVGGTIGGTGTLTVKGTAYAGSVSDVIIKVESTSSLHVSGTVASSATIIVGDGSNATNNGYAEIKTLAGKLITRNVGAVSGKNTADVKETTTGAQISINQANNSVVISEKNETAKVAMVTGSSLTVPPTVNSTTNPGLLVDSTTQLPVTTTQPVTITASSNIGTVATVTETNGTTTAGTVSVDAKAPVSSDTAGVTETSPVKATLFVVKDAESYTTARQAGANLLSGEQKTWEALDTHGKATLPWLALKLEALADLPQGATIEVTVKNGTQIVKQYLGSATASDTWKLTAGEGGWTAAAGYIGTMHWEMGYNTDTTVNSLDQVGGAKTGDYSVDVVVKKDASTTMKAPVVAPVHYDAPSIAVQPSAVNGVLMAANDTTGEGKTFLPADGQSFDVTNGVITVSKSFKFEGNGDKIFAGLKMKAASGAWFKDTDAYTDFVIVRFVPSIYWSEMKFQVKSPGGGMSPAATVGDGDPAYFIFAWNAATNSKNAPVTLYWVGKNASNVEGPGTGWNLDIKW